MAATPSGLPYAYPLTPAAAAPVPDFAPPLNQDITLAMTARPVWPAMVPINAAIDAAIDTLKNTIENRAENEHRYNHELYRTVLNLLYSAKNRGAANPRLTPAQSAYLAAIFAAMTNEAGNTAQISNASRDAALEQVIAQDANGSLTTGGWTPKPRRKPTRRRHKKRKSVKSPF